MERGGKGMSEPKFTKGPLEVIAFGPPTADWVGAQFFIRAKDAPGGTAAIMGGLGEVEEKANADLYAAAPDMYEALKDEEKQLVQMYRAINPAANEGEGNRMADNDWSVKSIRAALAKAAGVK
jgi:hypothetical protein